MEFKMMVLACSCGAQWTIHKSAVAEIKVAWDEVHQGPDHKPVEPEGYRLVQSGALVGAGVFRDAVLADGTKVRECIDFELHYATTQGRPRG